LRLNGTSAREHPVFRELTRVKQYFEKVKLAEAGEKRQVMRLDQAAAGRIIKHALVR
jgi:exosome complex protein LRP1